MQVENTACIFKKCILENQDVKYMGDFLQKTCNTHSMLLLEQSSNSFLHLLQYHFIRQNTVGTNSFRTDFRSSNTSFRCSHEWQICIFGRCFLFVATAKSHLLVLVVITIIVDVVITEIVIAKAYGIYNVLGTALSISDISFIHNNSMRKGPSSSSLYS